MKYLLLLAITLGTLGSLKAAPPEERAKLSKESEARIKAEQKRDDDALARDLQKAPPGREEVEAKHKQHAEAMAKLKVHPLLEEIGGGTAARGDYFNAVALIRMNEESIAQWRKKGEVTEDQAKMVTESLFPMIKQILPRATDEQLRKLFELGSKKLLTR